ncbi:uncharacterized protein LOC129966206 [Argiope bruennichi]|uniref:uncharacterized protein LOC129966206 n=1 Tax=Argiope bruennichi TaxID=94029 RepID=UPI0024942C7E|nr:uncharacterized protein LOC129966206 [Argiope bruennichi]
MHHLQEVLNHQDKKYPERMVKLLMQSFYVDNCVTSVPNEKELELFIEVATNVMAERNFQLRGWESTCLKDKSAPVTNVLGLQWDKGLDTLGINMNSLKELCVENVTKKTILSAAHRIFDPIGATCPVALFPKLLLQKTWERKLNWEEEVDSNTREEFLKWMRDIFHLEKVQIPRHLKTGDANEKCSLHFFSDASMYAYVAVAFLRVETSQYVKVQLLSAKARVSPTGKKKTTIARLDDNLDKKRRCLEYLRTSIIRTLTSKENWRHVPGSFNPADLPSRGCSAKKLVQSKWWEGPDWLYLPADQWPFSDVVINEDEVLKERKKTLLSTPTACLSAHAIENVNTEEPDWYYSYFSQYEKIVRMIGWILRFFRNCKKPKELRKCDILDAEDFEEAEKIVIKIIQSETFINEKDEKLKTLRVYKDEDGIIRLRTKIEYREDSHSFRRPVVLPSQHHVVKLLIVSFHNRHGHVGTQMLLNLLREHFWILNGRKTVRSIISKCVICKRHSGKNLDAEPALITKDRIRDTAVFEIVGVDLVGPLYLKDEKKTWVCLFTCAVYRAVHLELLSGISTDTFLLALRRFVARRGRCSFIYCDNGTNFIGASNLLRSLDWSRIVENGAINRIKWKFNPPTAFWWGGWWERLIRVMKNVLKRVLGHAFLSYEEMITVLCDCESIINSRPLTYISERDTDFVPLSPSLFLQDIREVGVPDCDAADHKSLSKRIKYRLALQKDLRKRFRSEYLGSLIQRPKLQNKSIISVGDVVLVGNDNQKRINWPLGRVTEIIPGKEGITRLVRLKTALGEILRPIQRLFPLEITYDVAKDVRAKVQQEQVTPKVQQQQVTPKVQQQQVTPKVQQEQSAHEVSQTRVLDPEGPISETVKTRSGRIIHGPKRLDL